MGGGGEEKCPTFQPPEPTIVTKVRKLEILPEWSSWSCFSLLCAKVFQSESIANLLGGNLSQKSKLHQVGQLANLCVVAAGQSKVLKSKTVDANHHNCCQVHLVNAGEL